MPPCMGECFVYYDALPRDKHRYTPWTVQVSDCNCTLLHPNSPLPTTKCRNLKHYWMPRLPTFAAPNSSGSLVSLHVEVPQLPWRCVSRRIAAAASRRGPVPRHRPWSNGYHGPPRHRGRAQPSSSFASEIMRNRDTKWEKIDEW